MIHLERVRREMKCAGCGVGELFRSQEDLERAFTEKNEVKSLQRAKGRVQGARPRPRPLPRPLLACGSAGHRAGAAQWVRCAGRFVGRAHLHGGPSARCQCITCSSGLSPGQPRAGEIKERVRLGVGTGCRGGGLEQFCLLYPGTGQAGWRR